jgi:release factor glutamine methyltransferase
MRSDLYEEAHKRLQDRLVILADKPEESVQNTLDALWFAAAGVYLSVGKAAGKDRPFLNAQQEEELHRLIELRLQGIPLAHITRRQQFMGLDLLAGPEALIPRKETELLAESAKNLLLKTEWKEGQPQIIDLCTGAGNIAIILALTYPNARVFAADISPDAVELAERNIELYKLSDRVKARTGDLFEPFCYQELLGKIDLITCNPPYISSNKVGGMEEEISQHEPSLAFNGGPFGITIINRLIQDAPQFLRIGGWLAFEIGLGQGETIVKRMKKKETYSQVIPVRDRENHIRVILAQR